MKLNYRVLSVVAAFVVIGAGIGYYLMSSQEKMPALSLVKHEKGGYTFMVDDKPFIVKGVCYNPIPIGKDYEYNFWGDPAKPWITDGKLMKEAGINSVRIYKVGEHPAQVKQVVSDLNRKFGIKSFVGHYLGFWDWPPANYSNPNFQKSMIQKVLNMVKEYKDEPGIVGWILGNENNYSFDQNVRPWSNEELDQIVDDKERREAMAKIYYKFVNDLAIAVKEVDPSRPVIMGVGEVKSLHVANEVAHDVDVLGVIAYRGATFGNLFRQVKQKYDKPVLMIEFGADSYNSYTREPDEASQARFLELQWKDIERNSTYKRDNGNAIGGLLFEWSDEWWKANEGLAHTWSIQDRVAQWGNSAYYYDYEAPGHMNINEEWFGIVSLKQKPAGLEGGLDKRVPKNSYYVLKDIWTKGFEKDYLNRLSIMKEKGQEASLTFSNDLSDTEKINALTNQGANDSDTAPVKANPSIEQTPQKSANNQAIQNPNDFVSGIVFYDSNENARYDRGEKGIEGVKVYLSGGGSAVSGPKGEYSISIRKPGDNQITIDDGTTPKNMIVTTKKTYNYKLPFTRTKSVDFGFFLPIKTSKTADPLGGLKESKVPDQKVQVDPKSGSGKINNIKKVADAVTSNQIGILAPVGSGETESVSGQVFYDQNVNSKFDSLDIPMSGIPILVNGSKQAVTDTNGKYSVVVGPSEDITVMPDPTYLDTTYFPTTKSVIDTSVPQGQHRKEVQFGLQNQSLPIGQLVPGAVEGVVFWDLNENGSFENNEPVIPGAVVTTGQGFKTVTDDAGRYILNLSGLSNTAITVAVDIQNQNPIFSTPDSYPVTNSATNTNHPNFGLKVKNSSYFVPNNNSIMPYEIHRNSVGGYVLTNKGEIDLIKAVSYSPIPANKPSDYFWWADPTKSWKLDAQLMQQMGIDAVKVYFGSNPGPKAIQFINELYSEFGIRTLVGIETGLFEEENQNDFSEANQSLMIGQFVSLVRQLTSSEAVIGWIVGDERRPELKLRIDNWKADPSLQATSPEESFDPKLKQYYSFIDALTRNIRSIDSNRLIIFSVPSEAILTQHVNQLSEVDAIGLSVYSGSGINQIINKSRTISDKPFFLTRIGADSFNTLTQAPDENLQVWDLELQWRDAQRNSFPYDLEAEVIGVVLHEWQDSWWRADSWNREGWSTQEVAGQRLDRSYASDYAEYGEFNVQDEWFGLIEIKPSNIAGLPDRRIPKKAYYALKNIWNEEAICS